MSHQQIPLHMHGLKDTLGLYCREKKRIKKTQNKQAVYRSAPATLAGCRGRHWLCSRVAGGTVAREVLRGHRPQAPALWEPLWKLLMNLPEDRSADCLCICW